jgi:hypothetical protein
MFSHILDYFLNLKRWFNTNIDEIKNFLQANLFQSINESKENIFTRSLVLHGLQGLSI